MNLHVLLDKNYKLKSYYFISFESSDWDYRVFGSASKNV